MGSQVMEVVVWVFSIVIVSTFLGMIFQVLRGAFDGYMDRWEKNYLVNKKAEYLEENILSVNDPLPGEDEMDDEGEIDDEDESVSLEVQAKYTNWEDEVEVDGLVDVLAERYDEEGYEDDWVNDPDVQDFLERADEPGPWSEEDDKIYTVGGLTADKDRDFMKFQNKMDERDKQLGGNSDNNVDDEKEE